MVAMSEILNPEQSIITGKAASSHDLFSFRYDRENPTLNQIIAKMTSGHGYILQDGHVFNVTIPQANQLCMVLMSYSLFKLDCAPDSLPLLFFFERFVLKLPQRSKIKLTTFMKAKGQVEATRVSPKRKNIVQDKLQSKKQKVTEK